MRKRENLLTILILAGLIGGVIVGQFLIFDPAASAEALAQRAKPYQTAGEMIFIRPLLMLVIPLVFLSVVTGVTSIGNPQKLGLVGGATLLYFLVTTALAVLLGLALVNLIGPGMGVPPEAFGNAEQEYAANVASKVESGPEQVGSAFLGVLENMIPPNLFDAAAKGNILGVVVFAILLGVALSIAGRSAAQAVATLEGLLAALMKIVGWVMWLAPLGVLLLIASRVGAVGLSNLVGPLGMYILTVIVGLFIHGFLVLPLILWVFGRTNPFDYVWRLRRVILTAFSTASSSATLPVTIETCRELGGCSRRAANFVPALGATVNMNGTALYEAVAVVFLFQVFGYMDDIGFTEQLVVLVTATLAAIGAPGIPAAGLVTMAIVIQAVNTSFLARPDTPPPLPMWTIGIIYGVDRILDMCRTTINVWGDAVGAKIITRIAPDEVEEKEKAFG